MIYTIVPLGNPGQSYEKTRHNAARIIIDVLHDDITHIQGAEIFVPETFMNESGKALIDYIKYHEDREIILMYDDKDLPLGAVRISYDRGDGGHNGVKSVIEHLGTKSFIRVRIGIAARDDEGKVTPPTGEAVQKYVMDNFSSEEITSLKSVSLLVLNSLKDIVEFGYQKAMERNN
jgi:PTH1 family peptidyl-tRNA hydrolase